MGNSLMLSWSTWFSDLISGLFSIIPKMFYLLYASLGSVGDVLQLIFRKMAGLDVYYVNGKAVTGDIVTNFIAGILGINFNTEVELSSTYSALSTVFWAFVIFGVVICVFSTIFTIIKGQYNYDDKESKGGPMQHIYTMIRTLVNMAVVPLVVVLGMYVSQAILTALDSITTTTTADVEAMYGTTEVTNSDGSTTTVSVVSSELLSSTTASGAQTYCYYDIFGYKSGSTIITSHDSSGLAVIATTTTSFSGMMFKVAAYNANRLRTGAWTKSSKFTGNNGDSSLFSSATDEDSMAALVDTAFACNLHYESRLALDYSTTDTSGILISSILSGQGTSFSNAYYITSFSKFDVGVVWYYYNLWDFNFLVGYALIITMLVVFINIVFGLMQRVIMLIALFLVMPAAYGITPLDGGEMAKRWRSTFLQYVLGAYGAVLGMNIAFLIMPYLNDISFTNIAIVDLILQSLFIIVALLFIKSLIATMSKLVGGADAQDEGSKATKEIGSTVGKAVAVGVGAVAGGVALAKGIGKTGSAISEWNKARKDAKGARGDQKNARKNESAVEKYEAQNEMMEEYTKNRTAKGTDEEKKKAWMEKAKEKGMSKKRAENLYQFMQDEDNKDGESKKGKDEMINAYTKYAQSAKTPGGKKKKDSAYARAVEAMELDKYGSAEEAKKAYKEQRETARGKIKAKREAKLKIATGTGEALGGVMQMFKPLGNNDFVSSFLEGSGYTESNKKRKEKLEKDKTKAKEDESKREQKTRDEVQEKILQRLDKISEEMSKPKGE